MTKFYKIILSIVGIVLFVVGFFVAKIWYPNFILTTTTLSDPIPTSVKTIQWKEYVNSKFGASFQYPSNWNVNLKTMSICPPEGELVLTPKPGLHNCVVLYSKERILNPVVDDMMGRDSSFDKWRDYVGELYSKDISNAEIRFIDFSYDSVENDWTTQMVGLAIDRRSNAFGLKQPLCKDGDYDYCFFIFKHILDSVKFIE